MSAERDELVRVVEIPNWLTALALHARSLDDLAHHLALACDFEDRNAMPAAVCAANDAHVDRDVRRVPRPWRGRLRCLHGMLVVRSTRLLTRTPVTAPSPNARGVFVSDA